MSPQSEKETHKPAESSRAVTKSSLANGDLVERFIDMDDETQQSQDICEFFVDD